MEDFKRLPWPVFDIDVRETYTLNMPNYRKSNPTDVFFCNLLDTDPYHLQHTHESTHSQDVPADELVQSKFIDPRTGIEIPTHQCNHKDANFEKQNIFLKKYIQASSLSRAQHTACLNVMRGFKLRPESATDEQNDKILYESSASNRLQEKQLFLDKLRENYFAQLSYRFHHVPPSINYFILQKWKKQLIEMHRRLANARYCMRTAISLQPSETTVNIKHFHQERLGCVPKMSGECIEYLKQSFPKLMNAYEQQKVKRISIAVKEKVNELIEEHDVGFVIPISILKLIFNSSSKNDWLFCVTVRESAKSTPFHPQKEIIFEKPLPPTYLSGNERHRKGAKYLLFSCLNRNPSHFFNCKDQTESETGIDTNMQAHEIESKISDENIEYKIFNNDEFIKQYPKHECSFENQTFTILEMGCDDAGNGDETFKILIPTKQAAYKKNKENGEVQFVNYSPKIEFQAEFGAETMTKDELLREWCDLYFRPKTSTERVRFDSESGKIVHRQTISLMQIESELKDRCNIEVQQLFQRLWNLLYTCNEFPSGEYLFQRDKKQLSCIKVYEKVGNDSTNGIEIRQIFKDVSFELNVFDKAEWLPIDDEIITELHDKLQILPCAFPHAEYLRENYVAYPIEERVKPNKTVETPYKFRKICPADDSYIKRAKLEAAKLKKQNQMKRPKHMIQAKSRKKAARRAELAVENRKRKIEAEELASTKKLFIDTLDQYNTVSGETLDKVSGDDSSIAARTRNRARISTPKKSCPPVTRRSSMNKSNK